MGRWRRRALLACALVGLLVLSGCWDMRDLARRGIILAIGLEPGGKEGTVKLFLQVPIPKALGYGQRQGGGGGGGKPFILYEGEGDQIHSIVRQVPSLTDKELFWGHTLLFMVRRDLAERGLRPYFDIFLRELDVPRTARIVVTDQPVAAVLGAMLPEGTIPALEIYRLLRDVPTREGAFVDSKFGYFTNLALDGAADPVATLVRRAEVTGQTRLRASGVALFRRDRMVGTLEARQVYSMLELLGRPAGSYLNLPTRDITVPCLRQDQGDGKISVVIDREYVRITPLLLAGRPQFQIEAKVLGHVAEAQCDLALDDAERVTLLQGQVAQAIEQDRRQLLTRLQDLRTDPLGMGERLRVRYSAWYHRQDWRSVWPAARFSFGTQVTGVRSGTRFRSN